MYSAAADPTVTDWIGAVSGIIAAIGGAGTLIIAIVLISKQHDALVKTINLAEKQDDVLDETKKALADEMQARREERERYRSADAKAVLLELGSLDHNKVLSQPFYQAGLQLDAIKFSARVRNGGLGNITQVTTEVKGVQPKCYVLEGDNEYREDGVVPVVPPGKTVSFYWIVPAEDDQQLQVEFTDENGVRWSKHWLNGLSEVPERA
ncbi:hypothetical protein [Nocardiopsis changdeensis]|uniref:hypothetical protein n=1 Tax=Nocardiopsis changdeensis TaxID=2831969 RepID=UPI003F48C091